MKLDHGNLMFDFHYGLKVVVAWDAHLVDAVARIRLPQPNIGMRENIALAMLRLQPIQHEILTS